MVVKDEIEQNRKLYESRTEVLDQAAQDIESEESSNIVAPKSQCCYEPDAEIWRKIL